MRKIEKDVLAKIAQVKGIVSRVQLRKKETRLLKKTRAENFTKKI